MSFAVIRQQKEWVERQSTVLNRFCKWVEEHTKSQKGRESVTIRSQGVNQNAKTEIDFWKTVCNGTSGSELRLNCLFYTFSWSFWEPWHHPICFLTHLIAIYITEVAGSLYWGMDFYALSTQTEAAMLKDCANKHIKGPMKMNSIPPFSETASQTQHVILIYYYYFFLWRDKKSLDRAGI